ncbi:CPI_1c_G0034240.mRNA.1.CDS.1 [Saccharomyces cerevisiae]|nr:CPI_1c_G0034240.mRNA.1.CDS.1 [Saccharomyces cerevisiae]CAI7396510.1 CPI_1c_G0034240.mRNA.1.CDS.1 [Saccharomyces cerevisiae]
MLESLAANLLNRLLGSYVENFDPNQLNVGIWSGDVKLKNLKLRKDCLDSLNLPIDVKSGILGDLVLTVPWSSLKNKPVKIIIEDCYLLCSPRSEDHENDEEMIKRAFRLKMRKVSEWELTNQARILSTQSENKTSSSSSEKNNAGFMQSLTTKIIDNLQVTIKNIHLRYEDMDGIFTTGPSSVGLTLNELSAVSTDSNWAPSFIDITQNITHKLLTLNSLCLYWNTDSPPLISDDDQDRSLENFVRGFKDMIASKNSTAPKHQYILKPVSGLGKLSINKLGSTEEQPHIDLQMFYDEFGLELDDTEYNDILHVLSSIQLRQITKKFKKARPSFAVSENPTEWFKYIAACVINEIHEKNKMWTWESMKEKCEQRRLYTKLWVEKLKLKNLEAPLRDPIQEAQLSELHKDLTYDEIILFRSVAKRQYAQYKLGMSEDSPTPTASSNIEPQTSNKSATKNNGSWLSSWWNGKPTEEVDEDLIMTEEQRQELYDAIEFDENEDKGPVLQVPRERVELRVTSLLKKGSFTIRKKKQNLNLGSIIFENCKVDFAQRPDSFLSSFQLNKFSLEDGSPNALYKHIISVRNLSKDQSSIDNHATGEEEEEDEPLLRASFELNPLDGLADSNLNIKLLGMTVFYHVHFITEVHKFFKASNQHMETIGNIVNAAEATVEGWTTQTRMGIESLLEDHKTVNVSLDLQAPLIILPLDPHDWDTPCAIIDAGHMSILSDLVPKEKIKEIKELSPEEYDKIDGNEINRLMFDRFQILSQDTQIFVGPDIQSTIGKINTASSTNDFRILDKMKLELTVDLSILPKAYKLPTIRVFGHLPRLSLSINDIQYKTIMNLIANSIPSMIDDEENNGDYVNYSSGSEKEMKKQIQLQLKNTLKALENMQPLQIEQKFLELHFDIDQAKIAFFQCIKNDSRNSEKLIDILCQRLNFNFDKRAKEMNLDLRVHSLDVEDYIELTDNKEFKNLISSGVEKVTRSQKDLFTLKYKRVQRIVSHNDTLIELFDQDIVMHMSELQLVLTPRSVLTLMNYAMLTFTDPNAPEMPADVLRHNKEDRDDAPQKINMKIKMEAVNVIFNDDSIKLATLVLSAGEFTMVLLPERYNINLKLGGLELTDETNESFSRDSVFRKIIQMKGQELVELSYESFDPATNTKDYDSFLKYSTGSMHVNFIESAVNRMVNFFAKFQKSKVSFDRARLAAYNQAPSIDAVNNMKMDIVIKAPIIQFPKLVGTQENNYDTMRFYLGEFFIENKFSVIDESHKINHIKLGVREGQLSSNLNFDGSSQQLYLVENIGLLFNIDRDPLPQDDTPELKVTSNFESFALDLTENQLTYLLEISNKVSSAFNITDENSGESGGKGEIKSPSPDPASLSSESERTATPQSLQGSNKSNIKNPEQKYLDFSFKAPKIALTLYNKTKGVTSLNDCGLTRIMFQDIGCSLGLKNDGTVDGQAHVAAFRIEDIRNIKDNKHTELIPKSKNKEYQFVANISRKNLEVGRLLNISMTMDSPKMILAMDYLVSLKEFFDAIMSKSHENNLYYPENTNQKPENKAIVESVQEGGDVTKIQYSVNIIETALILLADPCDMNSEAISFKIGQFLVTDQNIMTVAANNVGIFLFKMNSSEEKLRLLDDFSSSLTIDKRNSTPQTLMTNIQLSVQPLLMRISLRDIRLAMLTFKRVTTLLNKMTEKEDNGEEEESTDKIQFSHEFERKLAVLDPSILGERSRASQSSDSESIEVPTAILKNETFNADLGGLRFILIGDVHEMPILDMNVNEITASAKDWSTDFEALASLETYVNIFNYSRSSWEPLLEMIPITFHLSKGHSEMDPAFSFDILTQRIAEITLSARSIAMLSHIPASLTEELPLASRVSQKPYQLVNDTELDFDVWIQDKTTEDNKNEVVLLKANTSLPWEFEDWRSIREKLDIDKSKNILGVCVSGQNYKTIMNIDATTEGENLHVLSPPRNNVHNRIVCEARCDENNVKIITFRSTLVIENTTSTEIELLVDSKDPNKPSLKYAIKPHQSKSVPVEYAYDSDIRIRPASEDIYDWSQQTLSWKSLLSNQMSIFCSSKEDSNQRFHFEIGAKYDEREPLAKIFPHMKIVVSASMTIENLLPADINFSIFDKREEKRTDFLKTGESMEVHHISLDSFLLMSVQPLQDEASASKPSIVNTPHKSPLNPEDSLSLTLSGGQNLLLKLDYKNIDGTRSKVIRIYSPYIIMNSTDRELYIQSSLLNIAQSKILLENEKRYTIPKMFSFDKEDDKSNRARIRFKESEWSSKLSFDAIGQSFDASVSIKNKEQESNLGINISEGKGKYLLSKVIEIAPRYIISNTLDIPIEVCETGSMDVQQIESNITKPLYRMRNIVDKQLVLKFLGGDSNWSQPFFIKNVGVTYLKVLKNSRHKLLKIEILLDKATIFIRIKDGGDRWPFSVRNFSDHDFIFYQRDPRKVSDPYKDDQSNESSSRSFKPIFYRIPSKSIMPYAWDFPTAKEKYLVLESGTRTREVRLAEIGELPPLRLDKRSKDKPAPIVGLHVVADDDMQALVIVNYKANVGLYKLKTASATTTSSVSVNSSVTDGFVQKDEDEKVNTQIVVSFKGVGISLINGRLQELLYINMRGIELRYNESKAYQTFSWKMKWMQIDNQLFSGNYSNILYPTEIPYTEKEIENHPVISGSISKVNDSLQAVPYFKHVTLLIQEFSIQLDEDMLYAMMDFIKFPGSPWIMDSRDYKYDEEIQLPDVSELKTAGDIYFEIFHIQPTVLHLSFIRSDEISPGLAEETEESFSSSLYYVHMFAMTLGNINEAPVKVNSLFMDNVRVPLPILMDHIERHYTTQFVYQIHKILGSADCFGNPVGLFNTISSGVWDLFYEPYQGYMMNDRPQEIGIHLAKGGLSFAKKTVFGLSDSMSKFTGSMAKGLSVTQDLEFQRVRRLQQRINKNNRNALANSAQSFASTLGSGLSGIALDPYKAMQKEGAAGFLKGLGKGIVGLPTKTAIGFLDLTSNLSQGVKSTTTVLDMQKGCRVRLPRYVDHDQIIKPYDLREAQGQYWLKTVNGGVFMSDEYLSHVILPGKELAVIVSMQHIAEVQMATQELMWSTGYPSIQGITLERSGLQIKLKSQSEYFIPISDPEERRSLYRNIAIAVREYNKYCEAIL